MEGVSKNQQSVLACQLEGTRKIREREFVQNVEILWTRQEFTDVRECLSRTQVSHDLVPFVDARCGT